MLVQKVRKIKYRGVAMVEYAVLLAFVCVVAGVFLDNRGLTYGIGNIIGKVNAYLLSFSERYPNNNSAKFAEFCEAFGAVANIKIGSAVYPDYTQEQMKKKVLNDLLANLGEDGKVKNKSNFQISLSELTPEQKESLESIGLHADNFPNAYVYTDNTNKWYIRWTDEDLSKKSNGDSVKAITYSISDKVYYESNVTYNDNPNLPNQSKYPGMYKSPIIAKYDTNNQMKAENSGFTKIDL